MKNLWNSLKNKGWAWYAEWGGTILLMVGAVLNAYLISPWNTIFSFAGNFVWGLVAIAWKKPSLLVISLILTAIYVSGYISTL